MHDSSLTVDREKQLEMDKARHRICYNSEEAENLPIETIAGRDRSSYRQALAGKGLRVDGKLTVAVCSRGKTVGYCVELQRCDGVGTTVWCEF